ncbi:uncharacterized protein LOC112434389 [Maylandia zebra]|uniref:uncharacterized protein LOC112434389 n=1 Tax=Maylandia zebra TaxID=106582 RepID=UPI00403C77BC
MEIQVMFINTSSSLSSLNSSVNSFESKCLDSKVSKVFYTIYTSMTILLFLPLYIFILYMGFQQWCQKSAHAGATTTNSNFFTYNMMWVESFGAFGSVFYTLGGYTNKITMIYVGMYMFTILLPVETLFHVLTCLERYLAVVHPITYMHLRQSHGVRIRNICAVCAWLQWVAWLGIHLLLGYQFSNMLLLSYLGVCMVIVVFCCLSVLHVLNLPRPGDVGHNKEHVDQSKLKAFHMIMVITAVLLLRFFGLMICYVIRNMSLIANKDSCTLMESSVWLSVPSRLVLPLLYLHKAGKLSCCRGKKNSG